MSTTVTHDAPSAAAKVPTWRLLYWSVQRELWEHRSLYVAPLAVAALILAGFTIGLGGLPATLRTAAEAGGMRQRELVELAGRTVQCSRDHHID
jgi:ABC-2 type transport system permease protein